jgi:aspartate/methionine/tyrosine aminotransferase
MRVSERSAVDPFIVMDVMDAAQRAEAAGRSVIHMEIGQPATPAPAAARAALSQAMAAGPLGYTGALGLPELRARIARLYRDRHGVDLDPARVVVTTGSSAGFLLAFIALFDPGARVVLGAPGYPSYRQVLSALSLTPVDIPTAEENRLALVPGDLPADIDGVIVASPGNPTGTILDAAELTALVEAAASRGAALVSDEIYHGLEYGRRAPSVLEVTDDAYIVNSFSKYYSMTGWRIGWLVVPEDHVRTVERLQQSLFICPPHASQIAALAALDCEAELEAMRRVYEGNRQLMLDGLPRAGIARFAPPDGAFYVYADVGHLTDDSLGFARRLLEEAGVATAPGVDFDQARGHRWLRLSYAGSPADVAEGLDRLSGLTRAL